MKRFVIKHIAFTAVLVFWVFVGCFTGCNNADQSKAIDRKTYLDFGEAIDVTLRAYVLNVGQASCLVLESDGEYLVVDAGGNDSASYVFSAITDNRYIGISRINHLIFTHFDLDHIGAGPALVEKVKVSHIYTPDYEPKDKSRAYKRLMSQIDKKGIQVTHPKAGNSQLIFGDCTVSFVAPDEIVSDPNDNSIAILVEDDYGNTLYVGGDSGEKSESRQIDQLKQLLSDERVDVYIVNHHGSELSSSKDFLEVLNPKNAVISCAKDNTYGHPSEQTLQRLRNCEGCNIYFTYNVGFGENLSFVFSEDGVEFNY